MFPFKICKNDLKSFNQTRAALHTLTSSVLNSKQNLPFSKEIQHLFLQIIANEIYMSKNVWFQFANTAHTVLIGHKVILPIYSGNSSWRHSLITAQLLPRHCGTQQRSVIEYMNLVRGLGTNEPSLVSLVSNFKDRHVLS